MLALTTLIGIGLRRFANLQPGTALLGALPGGAGEMIAMSDSLGADVRLVTVMQYGRLLAILATISVVGHFAGAQAGGEQHAMTVAPIYHAEPLNYLISTIIALIGALVGGLDSVVVMATDLKADAALILAVHSLRLISVLVIGPYLVQAVPQRLNRQCVDVQNLESQ